MANQIHTTHSFLQKPITYGWGWAVLKFWRFQPRIVLKSFLNCYYFLIFPDSGLVSRNNKKALRNIYVCYCHCFIRQYIRNNLKLSIQCPRTSRACLSLFQHPRTLLILTSLCHLNMCTRNQFLKFVWSKFQPGDCS